MPRYSLAILDFDGTLADSFPWFCTVLNDTARRFGFREVGADEIEALRELGTRDIIRRLGVPAWKIPAIAVHMRRLSAEDGEAVRLFPGAGEMLAALDKAGIRVAIVSSNAEATIRAALGPAAAHVHHFDCGSSLFGKAAKFRAVLRHFGVSPAAAVAIGDEVRDIEAARRAGIAAAAVTFGYNTGAALLAHGPDLVFDDLSDLARTLTAE